MRRVPQHHVVSTSADGAFESGNFHKIRPMDSLSINEARRVALHAQGFGEPRARRPGPADMRALVERLRLIQIDSVNVLARTHYLTAFSRLGPDRREMLDEMAYRDQYLFEQWAHEACFVPTSDYPLLRHQMEKGRRWDARDVSPERPDYFASVLEEVRERGPVVTGEIEGAGKRQGGGAGVTRRSGLSTSLPMAG